VGVILGEPSGGLVDVDLDCAEAVELAGSYLPPTGSIFGREGKPRSHRGYVSAVERMLQLSDPETGEMLVELRTNGGQTVFPPSVHPTGEPIGWVEDGDPAPVDPRQLVAAVKRLAAACLLRRAGWALEDVRRFVAGAARLDHAELSRSLGEKRARKVTEWLGADPGRGEADPSPERPSASKSTRDTRFSTPFDANEWAEPPASKEDLEALADGIPNDNEPWDEWNAVGMGFHAASHGSGAGLAAWDRWARKSSKYHGGTTAKRWERYGRSPPTVTDIRPLIARARRADPNFRLPSWDAGRGQAGGQGQEQASTGTAGGGGTAGTGAEHRGRGTGGEENAERQEGEAAGHAEHDASWPEPEPLSGADEPQPFPLDALPPDVEAAVVEYQRYGQQPVEMVGCSAIAAMGGAVQGLADVRREPLLVGPTSVNVVLIAESGERKTACDNAFLQGGLRWERDEQKRLAPVIAEAMEARVSHEQIARGIRAAMTDAGKRLHKDEKAKEELAALKAQMNEHLADLPPVPPTPMARVEDGTSEGIAKTLREVWPSLTWASNEGGNVTGGHGFKDDAMLRTLAFINSRWDGAPLDRVRVTDPGRKVHGRRLGVSLMLQPKVFAAFTAAGEGMARGIGTLARNLMAWPRSTMGTRFRDEDAAAPELPALGRFLDRAEELHRLPLPMPFDVETMEAPADVDGKPVVDPLELRPTELPLSREARRLWLRYLNETEAELAPEGELADVCDVAAKSAENACRLAAIFHVWRHGPEGSVGAGDMERGIRVARWFLYEARRILGATAENGAAEDAESLARWIEAYGRSPTLKEVGRFAPRRVRGNKDRRQAAIRLLISKGWLRQQDHGGQTVLVLNPNLPWEG
jgi:hypothetical protein